MWVEATSRCSLRMGSREAMNEADDMFGEDRLSRLVEENVGLGAEALRERILGIRPESCRN